MSRVRAALAAAGALCLLLGLPRLSAPTAASWQEPEFGRRTFTAGQVSAPTDLACTTSGVSLGQAKFTWTAPSGGVTRTGYTWTVTGASASSGSLGASATTVTVSVSLLSLGVSTFTLRAVGPVGSGWTSAASTGTVTAVTSVLVTCSVP